MFITDLSHLQSVDAAKVTGAFGYFEKKKVAYIDNYQKAIAVSVNYKTYGDADAYANAINSAYNVISQ